VVQNPDKLVIDLDPSEDNFKVVQTAAGHILDLLDTLEITSFLMTTGSRGLHVVIPLKGDEDFEKSREAGKALGEYCVRNYGEVFTTEQYKEKRENKLYFDIQRNAYAQTSIAPYSLRARKGAAIATPLSREELSSGSLTGDKYHIGNIRRRLGQKNDAWKGYGQVRHSPDEIMRKLKKLNT
jgi:bifunctional non-homologous end joining protein LigD